MGRQYVIGDTGYTFITAEWVPEPKQIAQALVQFSEAIEDWAVPMEDAKYAVRDSVQRRFETQTDPYGVPWQELNPDYLQDKVAAGYDERILVRKGTMYAEAINSNNYTANSLSKSIEFDPTAFQEAFYAGWHQSGLPERTNPLPQRMFIGIDEEAAAEIATIFTEWLDFEWEQYWHSYTVGESVVSSAGVPGTFSGAPSMRIGQFGVRGFVAGHFVKGTVGPGRMFTHRTRGGRYAGL